MIRWVRRGRHRAAPSLSQELPRESFRRRGSSTRRSKSCPRGEGCDAGHHPAVPGLPELRAHLLKSPVFEAGKAAIVERRLEAYLAGDGITAAPILVPQVEADPEGLPR